MPMAKGEGLYRVLTWNINGGGTDSDAIVRSIIAWDADLLAITEFRTRHESRMREGLEAGGYQSILTTATENDRENGVLLASRHDLKRLQDVSFQHDPQRGLGAVVQGGPLAGIEVIAVHIPGSDDHKWGDNGFGMQGARRKELFWDEILGHVEARIARPTLVLGDLNTGLPADFEGKAFTCQDKMRALLGMGFVDAWRHVHGDTRDFTWYSRRKIDGVTQDHNGFRLDYVFVAPKLAPRIRDACHGHEERRQSLSDHSIVIIDLAP